MGKAKREYKELKVKVLAETAKYLEDTSKASMLPMGTIIDRAFLTWTAHDPAIAAELILEDMAIHIQGLEDREVYQTFAIVLSFIKKMIDEDTPGSVKELVAEIIDLLDM